MTNYYRPAANGRAGKWSNGEPASGRQWLTNYRLDHATGKVYQEDKKKLPAVRKKSNDKYIVCIDGPYHNCKLRRSTKSRNKSVTIAPSELRIPGWAGRYVLDPTTDQYRWRN